MRNSKFIALLLAFALILGSFGFAFADEDVAAPADAPETTEAPADDPVDPAPEDGETPADEPAPADAPAESGDIVILHTNDVHCANYENYAKLVELAKSADFVVDAGDAIQGGPIGALSKGEYITEIMNYVKYDVVAPGNHEFDYGMEQFKKITGEVAEFPYVCCNLVDLKTGEPMLDAYKIFEAKGKKIAFVGVDTPETFHKSTPAYFQDENGKYIYGFCEGNDGKDLYDAVQKAVDAARAEGADYVIVLGHLGIDEESSPWCSTEVAANTSGIDAFIDGHSHNDFTKTVANKEGKDVVIQQTGTQLVNIGKLMIAEDGTISGELIPTEGLEADADAAAFIQKVAARFEALTAEVVAKTEVQLTILNEDGTRAVRSKETNLGDLCADAYKTVLEADIAFVNGGGIRKDLPLGDVTYGDIILVHPFGNMACLVEVTGQQVLDALEMGYSQTPSETGGFLQVSGLTCTINTAIDSPVIKNDKGEFVEIDGQRRVSEVMINGEPIDPEATYKLASHNYMLKLAGDGYTMFGKDNVKILRDEIMVDNQVLISYIVDTLGGVVGEEYAESQGRINIIDDPSVVEAKPVAKVFSDVNEGDWFEKYLQTAYDTGIIGGFKDGTYKPTGNLTHAQIMVMVANLHSLQKGDEFKGSQIEGDHWAASFRDYCKAEGVIDDRFDAKLDEYVTRDEMAYYFANCIVDESYTEKQTLEFDDIEGNPFAEEISKLAKADIVAGIGGGKYGPDSLVTRAQAAVYICNVIDAFDEALVGEWETALEGTDYVFTYTFKDDGTGSYKYADNDDAFTYTAGINELSIQYEGENMMPWETTFHIDGDKLTVKDDTGADVVYTRK
ncbi:MAG: 5'-nucleotidase C-terminal domain-containing protein [Firmicutes bacterium]|nr:5'-nucleotidase C-terminal domain-containing protein [Bacillota bacterium]